MSENAESQIEHAVSRSWSELRAAAPASRAIAALQRLDDGRHPRAERSLDHDGVARLDGGEHAAVRAPPRSRHSRPGGWREGLPQRAHQRTAAEDEIDPVRDARHRQARDAVAAPCGPSSSMSPRTAIRRPRGPTSACAEQRQRRAHRGRVGVVALVDQQRRAARHRRARCARRARSPAAARRARAPRARDRRRRATPPRARRAS